MILKLKFIKFYKLEVTGENLLRGMGGGHSAPILNRVKFKLNKHCRGNIMDVKKSQRRRKTKNNLN